MCGPERRSNSGSADDPGPHQYQHDIALHPSPRTANAGNGRNLVRPSRRPGEVLSQSRALILAHTYWPLEGDSVMSAPALELRWSFSLQRVLHAMVLSSCPNGGAKTQHWRQLSPCGILPLARPLQRRRTSMTGPYISPHIWPPLAGRIRPAHGHASRPGVGRSAGHLASCYTAGQTWYNGSAAEQHSLRADLLN